MTFTHDMRAIRAQNAGTSDNGAPARLHDWNGIAARFACPDHRWPETETLPVDDACLRCDVCGARGYHVRPVPHWFRLRDDAPAPAAPYRATYNGAHWSDFHATRASLPA